MLVDGYLHRSKEMALMANLKHFPLPESGHVGLLIIEPFNSSSYVQQREKKKELSDMGTACNFESRENDSGLEYKLTNQRNKRLFSRIQLPR